MIAVISWTERGGEEIWAIQTSPETTNTTLGTTITETQRENSLSTSLVMQPSLLRSYRLKAQLSLSVMEPLSMMDRLMTKS